MQKAPSPLNATTFRPVPSATPAANRDARTHGGLEIEDALGVMRDLPPQFRAVARRRDDDLVAHARCQQPEAFRKVHVTPPPQHFAGEPDDDRTCHHAAMPKSYRKLRYVGAPLDGYEWDIDCPDYRVEIEAVRLMKLCVIARSAPQGNGDKERDLIGVIDLGDGIDAGEEAGRSHQRERPDPAEERSRAKADCRLFAVDCDMPEPGIGVELLDQSSDPAVWQAGDQRDAAIRSNIGHGARNGVAAGALVAVRFVVDALVHWSCPFRSRSRNTMENEVRSRTE